MNFDLPRVGGLGENLRAKYLLPCCCIHDSLKFDMQHDHALKILNFDLTPGSGVGGSWGSWGVVCGINICYHDPAFVTPFNLVCNMTML